MKMPRLLITPILCGFAGAWQSLLLAGAIQPKNAAPASDRTPSVLETDSLGIGGRVFFESTACIITEVRGNEDNLYVGFTGRWVFSLVEKASDTDQHGFSVSRDHAISRATWDFFARRFEDCRGKLVTISISTNGGCAIRGGTPFFDFPTNRFEITQPDLSTTTTPFSSIPHKKPTPRRFPKGVGSVAQSKNSNSRRRNFRQRLSEDDGSRSAAGNARISAKRRVAIWTRRSNLRLSRTSL